MAHPVEPPARTRTKLVVCGLLTVAAVLVGAPGWTVLALAATTVAIPLAVALAGGPALLRPGHRHPRRLKAAPSVRPVRPGHRYPRRSGAAPSVRPAGTALRALLLPAPHPGVGPPPDEEERLAA